MHDDGARLGRFAETPGDPLACRRRAFENEVPNLSEDQPDFWLWGDTESSIRVNEGDPQNWRQRCYSSLLTSMAFTKA